MRLHPRRVVTYGVLCACALIFLVTLQRNSLVLSRVESGESRRQNVAEEETETEEEKEVEDHRVVPTEEKSRDPYYATTGNSAHKTLALFPRGGSSQHDDRIEKQISFKPIHARKKTVYIYAPDGVGNTPEGGEVFEQQECLVQDCYLTTNSAWARRAQAVLVQNGVEAEMVRKLKHQIWIMWLLESPLNTLDFHYLKDRINWTASYRADSTLVTPYEKFVPHNTNSALPAKPARNYAAGKTKLVAWFVSNCMSNNKRFEFVNELRLYIGVHIFGACGTQQCPRSTEQECFDMLSNKFKFYLSFENSNCQYYITEKLFWNALKNDVVPVVMGARKEDYVAAAPPHSVIHIEDFKSAKELAQYLQKLDQDDDLYNEYFRWKETGSFINTKFWCRLCGMLHERFPPVTWYRDVEKWWRGPGTCTEDRWDKPEELITDWSKYLSETGQ